MNNPYRYGTLENTIYWGFYSTDNSLMWLKKYAAKKHKVTQVFVKKTLNDMFTEDERIERGNRIIRKKGLNAPQRKLPSELNKKLDMEYKNIVS